MKKFGIGLIVSAMLALTACGGQGDKPGQASGNETKKEAASGEKITIKFTHVVADDTPKGKAANLFRDLVKERLGDKVEVQVFPNSQLYDDSAGLEALTAGNIQMMAPSNSKMVGLDPAFQIYELPYLFKSPEAVIKYSNSEQGQKLRDKAEPFGVKVLSMWIGGFKQFTNNKRPIEKPEDFKGIKMRVMAGKVLEAQFKALGAGATVIPFSETYIALQQGTVDGQENPWTNIETQKFHEVQKYMTVSNHAPTTYPVIVNAEFWKGLPEDIRTQLEGIMKEVTEKELAWSQELENAALEKIKATGKVEITELNAEQIKAFEEVLRPVQDEFADAIGKENIEAARNSN